MLINWLSAQNSQSRNQYGLYVISNVSEYINSIKGKPGYKMVDIQRLVPTIQLDLRYAGINNFMHTKLYPALSTTYVRQEIAAKLKAVQKNLKLKGLGLKIFDAYRPYFVTEKMWEMVKDDRYAADPKFGSGHNRGIAIDVTIIQLKTKKELDMGTGFDNFSDTAHHGFKQLPAAVLENRLLLKSLMETAGFKALETEWWHYALPNSKEFDLLNLSFEAMKKLVND